MNISDIAEYERIANEFNICNSKLESFLHNWFEKITGEREDFYFGIENGKSSN